MCLYAFSALTVGLLLACKKFHVNSLLMETTPVMSVEIHSWNFVEFLYNFNTLHCHTYLWKNCLYNDNNHT